MMADLDVITSQIRPRSGHSWAERTQEACTKYVCDLALPSIMNVWRSQAIATGRRFGARALPAPVRDFVGILFLVFSYYEQIEIPQRQLVPNVGDVWVWDRM